MKIVRAMKKWKRLLGEINDVKSRTNEAVRTLEENEYLEELPVLKEMLSTKITQLVKLKTRIMHTNVKHGMYQVILELGELKSHIEYLRGLSVQSGAEMRGYSDSKLVYKSQLTPAEKRKMIEICQGKINELTDKLDEFNYSMDVEEMSVVVQPLP